MKKLFKIGCFGLIGLFVLLIVIGALVGDEETVQEESMTEQSSTAEQSAQKMAELNEPLKVGDLTFTAKEVSTADNIGGELGVNAQSQFTVVKIAVTNNSNESVVIDSSLFQILSGERTYDSDAPASIYANDNANFFFYSINPGVTLEGNVVFDMPADVQSKQLQVHTSFTGGEKGLIKLQ